MKIRSGFVSNSSTSSFIIVGIRVTKEQLAGVLGIEESILEEDPNSSGDVINRLFGTNLSVYSDNDYGSSDGFIMGKSSGSLGDGGFEEITLPTPETLSKICEDINKLAFMDNPVSEKDIKLFGKVEDNH